MSPIMVLCLSLCGLTVAMLGIGVVLWKVGDRIQSKKWEKMVRELEENNG
jgi:hypothetical protein